MSRRMTQIITTIIYNLLDAVYIGALVFAFCYAICKPIVNKINNTTTDLTRKQDILHQAIVKIRNIIHIDDDLSAEQTEQLQQISDEIKNIKEILNEDKDNNQNNNDEEDCQPSPKDKLPFHNQTHITFPDFFILSKENCSISYLSRDESYKINFKGNDLRLLSEQLSTFLIVNHGTCMELDEAFDLVFTYLQDNDITNITDDSLLCKLFGLNENEDYENSDSNIIKLLKKMMEPHLRKIV